MIQKTFGFLHRINDESRIHRAGIRTWEDYLHAGNVPGISSQMRLRHILQITQALAYLREERYDLLARIIPKGYHHRFITHMEPLYLDIEADHMRRPTIIGMSDGEHTRIIPATHLDRTTLAELYSTRTVITYNGSRYDIPILAHRYGIRPIIHIDLRTYLDRVGYRGGLKHIETVFCLPRKHPLRSGQPRQLASMMHHDEYFFKKLQDYVREDVESLIPLANAILSCA